MEYVTLNNGVKMPKLGYGVYQVTPAVNQVETHVFCQQKAAHEVMLRHGAVLVILPWIGYPRSLNALSCVRKAMEQA